MIRINIFFRFFITNEDKLKIFNSSIGLNLDSLPTTLNFMLIQMNKCDLKRISGHLNVFHDSKQYLKKMDLSNNELEEFPFNELYQMTSLIILKLSYNHLKSVPDEAFKGCFKLKMLDLSFNQINYLGDCF